jgi:tetratricopeptide (TPR) repeat protein
MATGQLPFRGETSGVVFEAIMNRAPSSPVRLNPDLPEKLEAIINKALEKDRNLRYQVAAEMRTDLKRLKREMDSGQSSRSGFAVAEPSAAGASAAVPAPAAAAAPSSASRLPGVVARASVRKTWPWLAVPAILAAVVIGGFLYTHRARALTEKDSILLTDFVNTTGDAVFDGTLKQALAVQLEQSPYLNLVPESRIQEALRYMGRRPDERITSDVAREICLREGVKAMLTGSIASLGSHYVITVGAVNAQTGDSLAREQVEAASKEQVLKSLDKAASNLRQKLGESLSSVQQFATPLEQATTSSLDALKEYSLGEAEHLKVNDDTAIPYLQRAIEIDPNFATAYAVLGVCYQNRDEEKHGFEFLKKAYDLRERASEPEKFYILAHYYTFTGEIDKAIEVYEQWNHAYPRDSTPLDNLTPAYHSVGLPEKALSVSSEAMRLDPKDTYAYRFLAASYLTLNRYEEARNVAEQAVAQKLDDFVTHIFLLRLAFIRGDRPAMQRELSWAAGKPREALLLSTMAGAELSLGRVKISREIGQQAISSANRHGMKEFASLTMAWQALSDAAYGYSDIARQETSEALRLPGERDTRVVAALALAQIGEAAKGEKLLDDLVREFPNDTLLTTVSRPTVRALNHLAQNKSAEAVTDLEPARKYELGTGPSVPAPFWPIYIRGQAFLRLRDGAKAAAEFQKILDHRGALIDDELYPLAQLNLARAYALEAGFTFGSVGAGLVHPEDSRRAPPATPGVAAAQSVDANTALAKARTAYQDFFALWKDADPDIPILKQAQAEYAKLQ